MPATCFAQCEVSRVSKRAVEVVYPASEHWDTWTEELQLKDFSRGRVRIDAPLQVKKKSRPRAALLACGDVIEYMFGQRPVVGVVMGVLKRSPGWFTVTFKTVPPGRSSSVSKARKLAARLLVVLYTSKTAWGQQQGVPRVHRHIKYSFTCHL